MEEERIEDKEMNEENDLQSVRRRRRLEEENKDKKVHITKMMITQTVICGILVLILFGAGKTSGSGFSELKKEYARITQVDMSYREIWGEVKDAMSFIVEKSKSKTVNAQTKQLGMGGDDTDVFSATSATVFSPFLISDNICTPVSGTISSPFGYRVNPVTKIWSFHSGLDIAANYGEKIKAAYYGIVEETGYGSATGNYVILRHSNNLKTKYLHCSSVAVKKDTVVRQGETIAYVGSTGMSTGPHLHFIIEIGGKKVNPEYVLKVNDGKV